ncbi:MAG: hypothetical protein LBL13_07440 [Bacteroidales bacterium]|jgi:hypothetical protein|nr:hypothetical protein [Bacteroidales bacterium]
MEYNNDTEYQQHDDSTNLEKTPTGLKALCILTFIGSGFSALAYLVLFSMHDALPEMMIAMGESMEGALSEYYTSIADMFDNMPTYFFLLMTVSCLLSIAGGGCMIKMRKLGFHLYVAGQVILLGLPMLVLKTGFNILGMLISFIFIILYSSYFKKMR